MNYEEQQQYFERGVPHRVLCIGVNAACGTALVWPRRPVTLGILAIFTSLLVTTAILIAYVPDYLNLSVIAEKRRGWAAKIRWRLVIVLISCSFVAWIVTKGLTLSGSLLLAAAAISLGAVLARSVPDLQYAFLLFVADACLILVLHQIFHLDWLLVIATFASAMALYCLTEDNSRLYTPAPILIIAATLFLWLWELRTSPTFLFLLSVPAGAAWLSHNAVVRNQKNVSEANDELRTFTGYSEAKIRELWATSNQQLARNWEASKLDESNAEKMAAWYRENSELYMFAISAYNLEYKRIKSNLAMMKYGRGKCLDYGAGNGELILEMARRGHPAVYYDVEGTSMMFARSRAEQRKLNVEFCTTKDCLSESAGRKGFDTIFSFDVLEHIPDLAGELDFLYSLLAPGGMMLFDVPAGSTKAHPMHLNHNLDVRGHMLAKGMTEEKLGWSFRKQEKYLFRKPA